jgi:hypothetical protein
MKATFVAQPAIVKGSILDVVHNQLDEGGVK